MLNPFSDLGKVQREIRQSKIIGGYTNQKDALRAAQDVLLDAKNPSSKYIIMVTDGAPTQNEGEESDVAKRLRSQGVEIIMIGKCRQKVTITDMLNLKSALILKISLNLFCY